MKYPKYLYKLFFSSLFVWPESVGFLDQKYSLNDGCWCFTKTTYFKSYNSPSLTFHSLKVSLNDSLHFTSHRYFCGVGSWRLWKSEKHAAIAALCLNFMRTGHVQFREECILFEKCVCSFYLQLQDFEECDTMLLKRRSFSTVTLPWIKAFMSLNTDVDHSNRAWINSEPEYCGLRNQSSLNVLS